VWIPFWNSSTSPSADVFAQVGAMSAISDVCIESFQADRGPPSGQWAGFRPTNNLILWPAGLVPTSRLVWSGSGLKSTWMENASVLSDARSRRGVKVGEMFCGAFDKTV
jgi:hypothetical protein